MSCCSVIVALICVINGVNGVPVASPTRVPTRAPTAQPTSAPTATPTATPTRVPTRSPTFLPSAVPTQVPTSLPTSEPSSSPTFSPPLVWFNSNISLSDSGLSGIGPWEFTVLILSNREVDRSDGGHFKLNISGISLTYGRFNALTPCIEIGTGGAHVKTSVGQTEAAYKDALSIYLHDIIDISVKRYGNGKVSSNFTTRYVIRFTGRDIQSLSVTRTESECAPLESCGQWLDPSNWENGIVPTAEDNVYISPRSGKILLSEDMMVQKLWMDGGLFIAQETGCPPGWSVNPADSTLGKCYKLMEEPLPYREADAVCRGLGDGFGSLGTSLVQIENYLELDVVKSICRGDKDIGSTAYAGGCWIGLQDAFGTGYYDWRDPASMLDLSFRDWRRGSDRSDRQNLDVAGDFIDNGDNCVLLVPWQEDALSKEQGSMEEISCIEESKAYVCQMIVTPHRKRITVTQRAELRGGGLRGGFLSLLDSFNITNFFAEQTAVITAQKSLEMSSIERLLLVDGSEFIVNTDIIIGKEAFIGELALYGRQPIVRILEGAAFACSSSCEYCSPDGYTVTINARVETADDVSIHIDSKINLALKQGGDIASSHIHVGNQSRVLLDGYAMRLDTYDAFDLSLSHRGSVIGEYTNSYLQEEVEEQDSPEDPTPTGVYRLVMYNSSQSKSTGDITGCIPYHASANTVARYLNALYTAQDRGGVTVRRSGVGDDRFHFGYDYRIELDAPDNEFVLSGTGGVTLEVYCIGILDCGCAQTKVSYIGPSGQRVCPLEGNSSRVNSKACAIAPTIGVVRMSQLDTTALTGTGELIVTSGAHRLPSYSPILVGTTGVGKGTVASNFITWKGLVAEGSGKLIFTGKGWEGWDSSILIFSPFDTKGRGNSQLNNAPAFTMTADTFRISEIGSVLTAGPGANLTWGQGVWNGGIIGGRSTVYINNSMTAAGTGKSLRYACTLYFRESSYFDWQFGNISMHNGAQFVFDGSLLVNVFNTQQFFGFSELLSMPYGAPYQNLLDDEPPYNDISYFDDQLADSLRDGSYVNPLCGDQCLAPAVITIQGNGTIVAAPNCNVTFLAPLNLVGKSQLSLGTGGYLNSQSGGGCGNNVFLDISDSAVIELSGGRFFMGATCTIKGSGELLTTAGTHDLSFSINAHITIAGGIMRWPASRGDASTLTFKGGLLIEAQGMLLVEPWQTSIVVDETVHFKDDCILQFPMIGSAAQASVYDSLDAPDLSPRGTLTATHIMRWDGGTLRGKADFIASNILYLSGGEKRIRSLAKLLNKGHAEWAEGNIIMADQADFVNLGTIQMSNGTELFSGDNLVEGTVIPKENGGDFFALQFHSWDLDQGALDPSEYIRLRTEFVSRAPIGWTEELDGI